MSINLNELLDQRAEATGAEEGRVPFEFNNDTFTFRDPIALTDDERDEINDLVEDGTIDDVTEFWLGEEEYDRFTTAGGTALMFQLVVQENARLTQGVDSNGRPTRPYRSSRRAAERKRRKQR
ncbi:hypothetical protein [Corynebacterium doosanense]|uniref:Uncharacterized protein n=1 Tax=Corynebacterium doosanense CAU 212 = DSM 45436 TaxID=558173 RepID=A0A097IDF6_9CORY|nr:hypothetical protein [Corynebacterium doosanense]AIT60166.1 hypothetical protein CDOO_01970 [Corynebacterium doosanense CAU 212 = DSM 45436]